MACRPPKEFRPPTEFFRSGRTINQLEVVAVDHLQPTKSSFGTGGGVSRPFAPLRRDFEQNPLKLAGTAEGSRRVLAGLGVRQADFGREERWVIRRHAVSTDADPGRFLVARSLGKGWHHPETSCCPQRRFGADADLLSLASRSLYCGPCQAQGMDEGRRSQRIRAPSRFFNRDQRLSPRTRSSPRPLSNFPTSDWIRCGCRPRRPPK
jgi:hypothetical protein